MRKVRQYKFDTIEICRNCGGSGKVLEERSFPALGGYRETVCPVCEGSGRVTKTKDITVTIESFETE